MFADSTFAEWAMWSLLAAPTLYFVYMGIKASFFWSRCESAREEVQEAPKPKPKPKKAKPAPPPLESRKRAATDSEIITGLMGTLPPLGTEWSQVQREQWLAALQAAFKVLYRPVLSGAAKAMQRQHEAEGAD